MTNLGSMLSKENIQDIYPLSPMQAGMFFYSNYKKNSTAYMEQIAYRLKGYFDPVKVDECFNILIRRYDILRTVFVQKGDNETLQVVLKDRKYPIYYKDVTNEESKEDILNEFKIKDRNTRYDLGKDVMMRLALFKLADYEYEFVWSNHHILMDGWCRGILISEFYHFYNSNQTPKASSLPNPVQYRDFIIWLMNQDKNEAASYWNKYLKDYCSSVSVPYTKNFNQKCEHYEHGLHDKLLSKSTSEKLRHLATSNQVTLNTIIQLAWGIVLSKVNNVSDVLFGTVVSGRPPEVQGIESMVGLFINTIPVRIKLKYEGTVSETLEESHQSSPSSKKLEFLSLAEIQSNSQLKSNLINHIVVFENYPLVDEIENLPVQDQTVEIIKIEAVEQTSYNFNLIILPKSNQIKIQVGYNKNYYHDEFIQYIVNTLLKILNCFLEDISMTVGTVIDRAFEMPSKDYSLNPGFVYTLKDKYEYPFDDVFPSLDKDYDVRQFFVLNDQLQKQNWGVEGKIFATASDLTIDDLTTSPSVEMLIDTGVVGYSLPEDNIFAAGAYHDMIQIKGKKVFLDVVRDLFSEHFPDVDVLLALSGSKNEFYLITRQVEDISVEKIEKKLHTILPIYMWPKKIFLTDEMPVLRNKVLTNQVFEQLIGSSTDHVSMEPGITKILSFWRDILEIDNIGIDDNFFDLGGNSIKIMHLYGLISSTYPKTINVADLYDSPTVRKQWGSISNYLTKDVSTQNIDVIDF